MVDSPVKKRLYPIGSPCVFPQRQGVQPLAFKAWRAASAAGVSPASNVGNAKV